MGRSHHSARWPAHALAVATLAFAAGVCGAQEDSEGPAPAGFSPGPADPYHEAMDFAAVEEAAGHFAAAARLLEAVYAEYPQDLEIAARLGALHLRAESFRRAERRYRDALALSPADQEAQRGLGWALLRQGRCGAAIDAFRAVLARSPEDGGAAAGMRLCGQRYPVVFNVGAALTGQFFPGAALTRTDSLGPTLHADSLILERLALGATYRYRQFLSLYPVTNSDGTTQTFQGQHELFLRGGFESPRFGLTALYGVLLAQGIASAASQHAGLRARLSLFGDVIADFSTSFYTDVIILRLAPSWRIPVGLGLSLQPGLAYQAVITPADSSPASSIDQSKSTASAPSCTTLPPPALGLPQGMQCATSTATQTLRAYTPQSPLPSPLLAGSLQIVWSRARFDLFAGAKIGHELRPAYLDVPAVYDLPAVVTYGLWGGATLRLGRFALSGAYAIDHLTSVLSDTTVVTTTDMPPPQAGMKMPPAPVTTQGPMTTVNNYTHAMTLGLSRDF